MATGETVPGSLQDSKPSIIADARIVREFKGTYMRTCDVRRQKEGSGDNWNEISLEQLAGQDITDTTDNRNYQQIVDTLLSITPTMSQILIKITDRTYRKIADVVEGKMGTLAGNGMQRKKDEDYLATFSTFNTGASPGAGNPLSFGHISASVNRIGSNTTEPSEGVINTILHGFQIYDIQVEVTAGVGTYTVPQGMTEEFFKRGFRGTVAGSNVFEDGNISIDASDDANGATHAKEGLICVEAMSVKTETDRDIHFGGGADVISMVDEYGFGKRSSTNWCYLHKSDATAPTS